jgi:hypothetical protein
MVLQPGEEALVWASADRHLSEHRHSRPRHQPADVMATHLTLHHASNSRASRADASEAGAGARMEALRSVMEQLDRDGDSVRSAGVRTVVLTFANMGYKVRTRPFREPEGFSPQLQWRVAERRQHAGRERISSPTLRTLQDLILLLPWVCFRGGKANPSLELSLGRRTSWTTG